MSTRGPDGRAGRGWRRATPGATSREPGYRRRQRRLVCLAVLLGSLVVACSGSGPQGSSGDTAAGKEIWGTSCATCHGVNGAGVSAPALNSQEFLTTTTDDQMDDIIKRGVQGTAMSAWWNESGGSLSDQEIENIIAYVRSWEPTAPSCPGWENPGLRVRGRMIPSQVIVP